MSETEVTQTILQIPFYLETEPSPMRGWTPKQQQQKQITHFSNFFFSTYLLNPVLPQGERP